MTFVKAIHRHGLLWTQRTLVGAVGTEDHLPISTHSMPWDIRDGQVNSSQHALDSLVTESHLCGAVHLPAIQWVLEDHGGREYAKKYALTEGGGDSLPIKGVFSHRGFWKFAFWLLRYRIRGYCVWSPCCWWLISSCFSSWVQQKSNSEKSPQWKDVKPWLTAD